MMKANSITSKVEMVSPQQAEHFLKFNPHNRSIRWGHVETIKQDILAGRWFVTHQGIAFGTDGNLIDGQHRLLAIVASGKPVQIMVSRGVEQHINGDETLFSMDVIDNGKPRTTADQLGLIHGISYSQLTVGALRRIAIICAPDKSKLTMTTTKAVPLLSIYGANVERIIELATNQKVGRKASVIGVISFAMNVDKKLAEEFITNLCTGDGIGSSDPVWHLREHIINKGVGKTQNEADHFADMIANAFMHTLRGTSIKQLKPSDSGLDFLRTKQRGEVEKVRAVLGYRK